MRQRFFTKTIQSDFVKSLLYNTPLPICNCVNTGDYLVKGTTYIFNRSLIRCTKNGYLRSPLKIIQATPKNILGSFILGYSTLGFRQIITKVCSGSRIEKDHYYLLGLYDLHYEEDEENPYQFFNETLSYSAGDIVIYRTQGKDYLYLAIKNISPGPWNLKNWQYVQAPKAPYQLIKCIQAGIIDDMPAGASYQIVQEFEPEIIEKNSIIDVYLSGNTYYVIADNDLSIDVDYWQYLLVYNEQKKFLIDFLEGKKEFIELNLDNFLHSITLPVNFTVSYEYDDKNGILTVDLDLPEIEDLPTSKASTLASGKVKIKNKTQKELKEQYLICVTGLAFFFSSHFFNLSTRINKVLISGFTQRISKKTGQLTDEYIYSVLFTREEFAQLVIKDLIPYFAIEQFEHKINYSKTFELMTIEPF